jgi:senataxin
VVAYCYSVETLHQTFELVKTILGRIAKTSPDVSKKPQLESTLYDIDKFARRATKSYRSRLSDDLLSELSDLLTPFNLAHVVEDDEIEFVKEVSGSTGPSEIAVTKVTLPQSTNSSSASSSTQVKDAFFEMMKKANGGKAPPPAPPKSLKPSKPAPPARPIRPPPQKPITVEDLEEEDDFLSNISASDLDIIEKRAQVTSASGRSSLLPPASKSAARPMARPLPPPSKLNINVVPKIYPQKPTTSSNFKSQVMRDLRKGFQQERAEHRRDIGGVIPKLPPASGLGSGLGAYTGPKRAPAQTAAGSGSSASESSDDDDNKGLSALIKAKTPKKIQVLPAPERRPIKILGTSNVDLIRQQTDKRTAQLNIKKRLKPDLSPLFRYILSWDPDHQGMNAPNHSKFASDIGTMGSVTTRFGDCNHYERVMLPLFLQELWAQTIKDQRTSLPVPVEVSTRTYEDDFLDVELVIPGNCPPDFNANEMDIVVLRQPGGSAKPIFAKVQGFRRKFKDANIKLRVLGMMDQRELGGKAKWMLHKQVA